MAHIYFFKGGINMCDKTNQKLKLEDIISSLVKKEVEAALGKYYESLINNASVNGGVK